MKSQDVLILTKLICLSRLKASDLLDDAPDPLLFGWDNDEKFNETQIQRIENINEADNRLEYAFTVRGLAEALGISKSEISNSIMRCVNVNLAKISRINQKPEVNKKVFFNFIRYGLRLVFPARPAEITRGIPTTFAAPVLKEKLLSAGDLIMVWPDAFGREMGQSVAPLYKSVPFAVRQDPELYSYLALLDAVRLGNPREMNLALEKIQGKFFNESD